jgi:uncharacterized protein (TIGR03435 family)
VRRFLTLSVVSVALGIGGFAGVLGAQTPAGPAFEVASIKPNTSTSEDRSVSAGSGRFTANNVTLRVLIRFAYPVQNYQLAGGPDWVNTESFDVNATVPSAMANRVGGMIPGSNQLMVQKLLAERFKLAVHHETRELPAYMLTLARNDGTLGPHLVKSAVDCDALRRDGVAPPPALQGQPPVCGGRLGAGHLIFNGFPLSRLSENLSVWVERFVIDRTGLTGTYDYDLQWSLDHVPQFDPMGAPMRTPVTTAEPSGPSLFTALQEQLGLKLESTRGPVDVLVIDHVEYPTEN